MEKTNKPTCIVCGKQTVSLIETTQGLACYLCFTNKKGASEPAKSKRSIGHEEDDMQAEFFKVLPTFFPNIPDKLFFAIPNGGKRDKMEAIRLKRQGVKAGVTDTLLLIPKKGFSCLCLEFKTLSGTQSDDQKEFQRQIEMCGGKYEIVRSVGRAIDVVKVYLK